MRSLTIVVLMLILTVPLSAQSEHSAPDSAAFEIDFAKVKWENLLPNDSTVQLSKLHVDPITGATQMIWRLPPSSKSPCHRHIASESNVVVQGSLMMRHKGAPPASLGVGGFGFVPKSMPHQLITGPTPTIVFSSLDGPFTFEPVPDSLCGPR